MKKALIIGGGMSGCAVAHQMALVNPDWDITVIERGSFLGGGVKTHWRGGHPFTFGPRHFLTPLPELYEYLNSVIPMRRCQEHEFITYIEPDQNYYSYPIHADDISRMPEEVQIRQEMAEALQMQGAANAKNFEEYWTGSVGKTLYSKFVDGYSRKMWQLESNQMIDEFSWSPKGVTIKEGPRATWDTAISAYPIAANGYDDYFDIATQDATVLLNTDITDFDMDNKRVRFNGEWQQFDMIISTISPDTIMNNVHGELPYVGREFMTIILPTEFAFPENVYFVYYAGNEPYTRIVEYKKLTQHKSDSTLLGIEIPSDKNKLYPLPIQSEIARAYQYFSDMPEGVISMGRMGSYKYIDIDDIIFQAMELAKQIKEGGVAHPVPVYGSDQLALNLLSKMIAQGTTVQDIEAGVKLK
jgi:UDP-galactopyranose mutase